MIQGYRDRCIANGHGLNTNVGSMEQRTEERVESSWGKGISSATLAIVDDSETSRFWIH